MFTTVRSGFLFGYASTLAVKDSSRIFQNVENHLILQCWRKWEEPHKSCEPSSIEKFHIILYSSLHFALLKTLNSFCLHCCPFGQPPRIIYVDSYEYTNKICLHKRTKHKRGVLASPKSSHIYRKPLSTSLSCWHSLSAYLCVISLNAHIIIVTLIVSLCGRSFRLCLAVTVSRI